MWESRAISQVSRDSALLLMIRYGRMQAKLRYIAFRIDGHTVKFSLAFEDMDGNKQQYSVSIAFYGEQLSDP